MNDDAMFIASCCGLEGEMLWPNAEEQPRLGSLK